MTFDNPKIQSAYDKMTAFFEKFSAPVIEAKFTEAKLADGVTIIKYAEPELAQGVVVNVVTEAGELPIPDGEYELEDGSKLVTSGGLVAEYTKAEEKPADEVADPTAPAPAPAAKMDTTTAPKRVIKSQVEEHVFHLEIEGIEPIKVDFSSMFEKLKSENEALKELNKEMFEAIKSMEAEPAVKPTEKKVEFVSNIKKEKQDIKEAFKNLLK